MVCAAAMAAAAPQTPQATPQSGVPAAHRAEPAPPDEDFIEFLGADDVGDAAWWEFLKKVPLRGAIPPPPPPREAQQQ